ncbi:hypothetical protein IFM89_020713 [Coptis chinensis]|uniref:Metallo-beta-lactamase domain-containing protein n=1 Tax=Coptis chinensis TaxID=261450 RepID=A0A835HA42_9MAGN|nr:hypothetical protein IFM89_020713 [Coptis chinensis]
MSNLYKLALIIKKNSSSSSSSSKEDEQFLLIKQTRPPKFNDEEYDSFVDSDLYDLPCVQLNPLETDTNSDILIQGADVCQNNLDLTKFDVNSALNQVLSQVGCFQDGEWEFWKYVEEPEFGPRSFVHTVFITGKKLKLQFHDSLQDVYKWMSIKSCLDLLLEVKPSSDRVGPLMAVGIVNDSVQTGWCKVPSTLRCQEYPPGVKLVPMGSRTGKPFTTTNLVIVAPDTPDRVLDGYGDKDFAAYGDALIIDPGCLSQFHEELAEIVTALPRKLVVFVTHHHYDHVDGLSVVQKCNPDAILLAHENTMKRIGKDTPTRPHPKVRVSRFSPSDQALEKSWKIAILMKDFSDNWSRVYTTISGAEEICIAGQQLKFVFAPGHTDGHMAILHASSHSLIVGDHCVGNRRNRESSILKAIESGATTLFDIVAKTYSDVDRSVWIHASSNVRLHVDYLAQQHKLPKGFSLENFNRSCAEFVDKMGSVQSQMRAS